LTSEAVDAGELGADQPGREELGGDEAGGDETGGDEAARRRRRGIEAYARIFDVPLTELPAAFARRVGSEFADEALQVAGGTAWANPALTARDRSIAIITALAAQGVTGDRLNTHLQLARQVGLDDDALTALMTLLAVYLGYARASLAMESVHGESRPTS
jgi:4-carboxymuconolactone decarboxylase